VERRTVVVVCRPACSAGLSSAGPLVRRPIVVACAGLRAQPACGAPDRCRGAPARMDLWSLFGYIGGIGYTSTYHNFNLMRG
jgi:hypothetical protein